MYESVISIYRAQPKVILNYEYVFSVLTIILILYVLVYSAGTSRLPPPVAYRKFSVLCLGDISKYSSTCDVFSSLLIAPIISMYLLKNHCPPIKTLWTSRW